MAVDHTALSYVMRCLLLGQCIEAFSVMIIFAENPVVLSKYG